MSIFSYFRRPTELDTAREQLALVETRARLAAATAQERLLQEAISSNNPQWQSSWELPPWATHTPTDAPLNLPLSDDDLDLERLAAIRTLARRLARRNGFAINILKNCVNFVVGGDGMKLTASTKDEASAAVVAAVQDVLDEFAERTLWNEWQQEIVRRTVRDGEALVRLFDSDGYLEIRIIEPDWVQQPDGKPDMGDADGDADADDSGSLPHWCHGICFDGSDRTRVLGYWVVYPGEAGEFVKAAEVVHFKANVDRNVPRGLSDFFASEDALNGVADLLHKTRVGEGLRAAITGFWEYENSTAAAVAAHIGATKDALQPRGNSPDPVTGKTDNYQHVAAGTFIHTPKGKKYLPPPASPATSSQVQVVQACLRSVAARWNMPEFMISADASNNNYASILVSGGPFCREIVTQQGYFKARLLLIAWKAVECAVKGGRVSVQGATLTWLAVESVTEIQAEAPPPELSNELEQSQVDAADMAAGVMSKQTRAMRRGLDWEQEKKNLESEPKAPPTSGPLGMPGLPGGPAPVAESLSAVLECGGEGGKPGPCPSGRDEGKGKDAPASAPAKPPTPDLSSHPKPPSQAAIAASLGYHPERASMMPKLNPDPVDSDRQGREFAAAVAKHPAFTPMKDAASKMRNLALSDAPPKDKVAAYKSLEGELRTHLESNLGQRAAAAMQEISKATGIPVEKLGGVEKGARQLARSLSTDMRGGFQDAIRERRGLKGQDLENFKEGLGHQISARTDRPTSHFDDAFGDDYLRKFGKHKEAATAILEKHLLGAARSPELRDELDWVHHRLYSPPSQRHSSSLTESHREGDVAGLITEAMSERFAVLESRHGADAARAIIKAVAEVLGDVRECGGKGGKPGPCPDPTDDPTDAGLALLLAREAIQVIRDGHERASRLQESFTTAIQPSQITVNPPPQTINITVPEREVVVNSPPPTIVVEAQQAPPPPVVNVHIPQQPPPTVNVSVPPPAPVEFRISRDANGKMSGGTIDPKD